MDYTTTIIDDKQQHWILTFAKGLISITNATVSDPQILLEYPHEELLTTTKTTDRPLSGWSIYTTNISTTMFTLSIETKSLCVGNELIRENLHGNNIAHIKIVTKCSKISFIIPYIIAIVIVNIASGELIKPINVTKNT